VLTTEKSDFVISTSTDPKMTAGAIASAAREGTASSVQGIGPDSVFNCIRAVAIAREYLDDKDDKVIYHCPVCRSKVRERGGTEGSNWNSLEVEHISA
jgi:stage V sporulation protein SpoVS